MRCYGFDLQFFLKVVSPRPWYSKLPVFGTYIVQDNLKYLVSQFNLRQEMITNPKSNKNDVDVTSFNVIIHYICVLWAWENLTSHGDHTKSYGVACNLRSIRTWIRILGFLYPHTTLLDFIWFVFENNFYFFRR